MSRPFQPALVSCKALRCRRLRCFPYLGLVLFLIPITSALGSPPRSPANTQAQNSEARPLEPGKSIEREITGGETHAYQLTLAAGQYARVAIDQRRINIAVAAFDSDGKKITDEDWFLIGDAELVSLIADSPNTYRLEVRSPDKSGAKGSYEIKIKELHPVTEKDRNTVAGERLLADGYQLASQPSQDSGGKYRCISSQSLLAGSRTAWGSHCALSDWLSVRGIAREGKGVGLFEPGIACSPGLGQRG